MMRCAHGGCRPLLSGSKLFVTLGWICAQVAGGGCADESSAPLRAALAPEVPSWSTGTAQEVEATWDPEPDEFEPTEQTEADLEVLALESALQALEGEFVEPGSVQYPVRYLPLGGVKGLVAPHAAPPAANVWHCRSSRGRDPVVLVHGTLMNQRNTWTALAPLLWNAGFCVYTFTYGGPPLLGTMYGIHSIADSAEELRDFVDEVLERTGASKVDLIGHSQGSLVSRYYLAYLEGADKVDQLIGLAPSNHGSSVHGLEQLIAFFGVTSLVDDVLTSTVCGACAEQLSDSPTVAKINAPGDTLPGVRYTVLSTRYDELVTPVSSTFLQGATNLYVQDVCPLDGTGHIGIVYDPVTLQLTLNALDPASAKAPKCRFVPWLF